jgi:hypothetical protein
MEGESGEGHLTDFFSQVESCALNLLHHLLAWQLELDCDSVVELHVELLQMDTLKLWVLLANGNETLEVQDNFVEEDSNAEVPKQAMVGQKQPQNP